MTPDQSFSFSFQGLLSGAPLHGHQVRGRHFGPRLRGLPSTELSGRHLHSGVLQERLHPVSQLGAQLEQEPLWTKVDQTSLSGGGLTSRSFPHLRACPSIELLGPLLKSSARKLCGEIFFSVLSSSE